MRPHAGASTRNTAAVASSFTIDATTIESGGAGTSGAGFSPANTSGEVSSTSWRIASTASGGVGNSPSIARAIADVRA